MTEKYITNLFNAKKKAIMAVDVSSLQPKSQAYYRENAARNACFNGDAGIGYKRKQIADQKAIIMEALDTPSDVVALQGERARNIAFAMQDELDIMLVEQEVNLAVYKDITGNDWKPVPKGTSRVTNSQLSKDDLKDALARLG